MISAFLLVLVLFYVTFLPQFIAQNMLVVQPSYLKEESFVFLLYASYNMRTFKEVFCGCGSRNRSTNAEARGRMMAMMTVHRTEPATMNNNQRTVMLT